jgi:hypothetical protein
MREARIRAKKGEATKEVQSKIWEYILYQFLEKRGEWLLFQPILPFFYILRRSYDMLVHIPCNDQRCAFHILEHMHHIRRHIDCRTALQTGCPLTSMLQMSNKQLHILY